LTSELTISLLPTQDCGRYLARRASETHPRNQCGYGQESHCPHLVHVSQRRSDGVCKPRTATDPGNRVCTILQFLHTSSGQSYSPHGRPTRDSSPSSIYSRESVPSHVSTPFFDNHSQDAQWERGATAAQLQPAQRPSAPPALSNEL